VLAWLDAQPAGSLAISAWVSTELSSALALQLGTGAITLPQRADVLAAWRRLVEASLHLEPVREQHFAIAARFLDRHMLGLRAGDALHLAIAADRGLTLATLDKRMAAAGQELATATLFV
jgi:hypothetical protein